jgi:hypothetical protein
MAMTTCPQRRRAHPARLPWMLLHRRYMLMARLSTAIAASLIASLKVG